MRVLRIDDYPMPNGVESRHIALEVLDILNDHNVPYLLGVVPDLLVEQDFDLLDKHLRSGQACMHGFDHAVHSPYWAHGIEKIWPLGGEFINMSEDIIEERFTKATKVLSRLKAFNPDHFIAPFNTYTQELVNVLDRHKVTFLHTCDKEYDSYNYKDMDYKSVKPVISLLTKTYDYASNVVNWLHDPSQITLHWYYDCQYSNWREAYTRLCIALQNHG